MRALVAALAALCIAGTAEAKVLVTWDQSSGGVLPEFGLEQVRGVRSALHMLGLREGVDFVVAHPKAVRTEFARIGQMTWNFGTAGAYTESFDAVIHCGFNGRKATSFANYRPDSLTLSATKSGTGASHGRCLPTVPQLFIFDGTGTNLNDGTAVGSCTTGVSTTFAGGDGSGNHEGEGTVYKVGSPLGWFDANYSGWGLRNSTSPAGGWRPLLGIGANAVICNLELTGNMPVNADSVARFAFPDSVVLWERPNAHVAGAAVNVFLLGFDSGQATDDSTGGDIYQKDLNWPNLYCALARLDSLTGGAVLKGRSRSFAFLVEGGGTRSDRRHPGGVFAADTTVLRATADSVRALGVPLTVAADPESLTVNAGDVAIWKAFGDVRFAPWVRVGMDTTVAGLGNASVSRVVDPFGRFRVRAAVGPGTADSSVYALVKASRDALRAQVGGRFLSGAVVPFADDWSPKQMRLRSALPTVDSLMYALRLAGVTTLVINQQTRDTDPAYAALNPRGFGRLRQQVRPVRLGSVAGDRITLLGFTQRSIVGSNRFLGALSDTIPPYCDPGPCAGPSGAWLTQNGFWHGMHEGFTSPVKYQQGFMDDATSIGVVMSVEDKLYGTPGPASLCVISAQSLAGDNLVNPTRPGWYVIKHLTMAARAANAFAARPVLRVAHVDEVRP